MDAFFAAVEERDHEWLKGKPIVVGADPQKGKGRGVVSTANYKAREYGIKSAMPISRAWQLSEEARIAEKPPAEFLQGSFLKYEEVSKRIFKIVRKKGVLIEEASVDEVYLDLSDAGSYKKAILLCKSLKQEIFRKEKLTCSAGIGPNKLIAKIASDMQKPNGLTVVGSDNGETRAELVQAFLEPLPIRKIPGIGPKTEKEFLLQGIKIVKDLKKFSRKELQAMMGKWGIELYDKIRGIDDSPVTEEYEVKSIGEQETFAKDTLDQNFIFARLRELCRSVVNRFQNSEFKSFRTVAVTVRFSNFVTLSRVKTLEGNVNSFDRLHFEALKLLIPILEGRENLPRPSRPVPKYTTRISAEGLGTRKRPIRLIGVRIEKLVA